MNGVHHIQKSLKNVLYMENHTPGTPDLALPPEDAATATAIATAVISHAKQKIWVGTAFNNASIAAKAPKFPTTIGENDDGTAVTEITTQDQLNELTRIQANVGNQMSDLIGKLSREWLIALPGTNGIAYPNHYASSYANKLILSYDLKYATPGVDPDLGPSFTNPNIVVNENYSDFEHDSVSWNKFTPFTNLV